MAVVLVAGLLAAAGCSGSGGKKAPALVVGVPDGTGQAAAGPQVITSDPDEGKGLPPAAGSESADVFVEGGAFAGAGVEPGSSSALAAATGKPWAEPVPFTTGEAVPDGLAFILVAGSDARPGEDLLQTRADSLHLLCLNPATGQGTLLGFPRDSWVEIPGHGRGKINNALALGGPNLLAATVRRLTGLPVDYYVLTGFPGLVAMVDDLGGVDVPVERRMNDPASGARFQRGWHHMTGRQALAFARDRKDVERGDLTRSEHQGLLMLSALAKMRAEVADDGGVARWVSVLVKYARLDIPLSRLPAFGALARRLDPGRLNNVVAPGRVGTTAGQSVVFLTTDAARMFEDLRGDAVIGAPSPEPTTSTTAPAGAGSPSSTTAPARTPAGSPAGSSPGASPPGGSSSGGAPPSSTSSSTSPPSPVLTPFRPSSTSTSSTSTSTSTSSSSSSSTTSTTRRSAHSAPGTGPRRH